MKVKLQGANGNVFTQTDSNGDYHFNIPDSLRTDSNKYTIQFTKEGFVGTSSPAFPETGVPLPIILYKPSEKL